MNIFKNTALLEVLFEAYKSPFKLQSDYAREFSQEVGALASLGYISTMDGHQTYGRKWRVTGIGIDLLRAQGWLS